MTTSGKGSRKKQKYLAANSSGVRWNPFAAEASKPTIPCIGRTSDKSEKGQMRKKREHYAIMKGFKLSILNVIANVSRERVMFNQYYSRLLF